MGHVHSRPTPSSEAPTPRRTKGKASITRAPLLDLSFSASAWTSPTSRFGSRARSQRRAPAAAAEEDREAHARREQREEMQRFLAEAMEHQREAERTLAEAHLGGRSPSVPRLVLGDCGEDAGGLDGLMIAVDGAVPRSTTSFRPRLLSSSSAAMARTRSAGEALVNLAKPLRRERRRPSFDLQELQSARSATPGMSISSSATLSTASHTHHSPTPTLSTASHTHHSPTPTSHWSESSASEQTPPMSFATFRNSLNRAQLNRLSVLLANPDKLDDADIAVANEVLSGRAPPRPAQKSARLRGPITVVSAEPIGARRYAELEARRVSKASTARKSSVQSDATLRITRMSSGSSLHEVWSSEIPFPATAAPRHSFATVDGQPLSPRFSTTPATLAELHRDGEREPHAPWLFIEDEPLSPRSRARRPSVLEGLGDYIAASPQLAFPAGEKPLPAIDRVPLSPRSHSRTPSATLPRGHPASHHARFDTLDRLAVPPRPHLPQRGSSSPSSSPSPTSPCRHSSCAPSSYRTRLGSVAEDSPSPTSPTTGDEVPLCLTPGVVALIPSTERADGRPRPVTMSSSASATSFPHSVAQDDGFSEARSPSSRAASAASASYFDAPPLPTPLRPAALPHIDFSGYSLAPPPQPQEGASRPHSFAESDLPLGGTLDAFPAPPRTMWPAARDSLLSASSAVTEEERSATPSSVSALSSAATSAASIELPSAAADAPLTVSFSALRGVSSTFSPLGAAKVAAMVDSPARRSNGSSPASSLGTFVLEELVDELLAANASGEAGLGAVPVYPDLDEEGEEAPPVPPKEPTPSASPGTPPRASLAQPSPLSQLAAAAEARFPLPLPAATAATALDSHRFPAAAAPTAPQQQQHVQRRGTFPLLSSASFAIAARSAAQDAEDVRLGCRHKRGFSRDEIGEWLVRGGRGTV
ncbi:hypothetical protein JCM10449v2_004563 [Rhodotorula kratochvilovae]